MHKRITWVFCLMILLMTGMIYRIYYIDVSDYITAAASVQGKYRLGVADTRGTIYDRNLDSLVNNQYKYVAAVLPTPQAASALLDTAPDDQRQAVLQMLTDGRPFAMEVTNSNIYAQGVDLFRVPQRYSQSQYAPHLIGYLGDGGVGVAGIERAYDDVLKAAGGSISIKYQTDASGRVMQDTAVSVERANEEAVGGVVLTLDKQIQAITQNALTAGCEKGAAVVLDIQTGDILAMASLPVFDQNDISDSLESTDAPFINRAISGYNIGSVFKLIVSSAALESGVSRYFEHDCPGYVDVDGQIFRCNNNAVHGVCDMERALEVSCNAYFITLAQEISPTALISMSENMGLGKSLALAPGINTQPGNLPTPGELEGRASYANFSFGQGSSLASPLQMAQAVAVMANSGKLIPPRLIKGTTSDGRNLENPSPLYSSSQVLKQSTAQTMQDLMVKVVSQGSGRTAAPLVGGAGGKTSSAQTGQMVDDAEIVHAWFAGFYPADQPKYSVVVFVEGGESGEHVAAPIFKSIVDGIGRAVPADGRAFGTLG